MIEFANYPDDDNWRRWWALNHPWDWWAKERHGEPLPGFDRLLVAQAMRDAYEAGKYAAKSPHSQESK